MTEQEILEKIKNSARDIEIPDSLEPEAVKERLEQAKRRQQAKRAKTRRIGGITAAAACLMLAYTAHVFVFSSGDRQADGYADKAQMQTDHSGNVAQQEEARPTETYSTEEEAGETADSVLAAEPKRDAGELYTVAKNYGEVYDALSDFERNQKYYEEDLLNGMEQSSGGGIVDMIRSEAGVDTAGSVKEAPAEMEDTAKAGYSTTNLQTEGVDESDIIKNDGRYIYTVDDGQVNIVDTGADAMKLAGTIVLQQQTAADRIQEMYIDGDTLNLIVEREETSLSKRENDEGAGTQEPMGTDAGTVYKSNGNGLLPLENEKKADYEVFFTETQTVTEVLTYDIADRSAPKLIGSVEQQGYYKTSRKIGQVVYLFTSTMVSRPTMQRSTAIMEKSAGGWIPLVNGEPVAADCIYLPRESGDQGLLVTSVNIGQPDKIVDHTLILSSYADTYVSADALYLYYASYEADNCNTQIAKFSLKDGQMNAVGAASVKGMVNDTFAIHESSGKLRVLTTDYSGMEESNALYLLDEKLSLTGKLEGIAKGEQIYAARYLGNMAYFVTYRNTDPLFAVDLTDETNPVIRSELKITGFSEYLHFWGEDKLLGIGYETDPDSGSRKGIKISMFDISNPSELTTLGTCVIAEADYSPALYNYKCVLVDARENLIGLAMENYGEKRRSYYSVFQWRDGKFHEIMTEAVGEDGNLEDYRGIYIGQQFFIAAPDEIISYDRADEYRMKEKLTL